MLNNTARKFSVASSVASPGSSIYYTPTEYPLPPTITGPSSSCPPPRVSSLTRGHISSARTPSIPKETLVVPNQKPLTASTISLAGSLVVSNDEDTDEKESDKKFEDFGSRLVDENNNDGRSLRTRALTMASLTPIERVALKGFASQRRKNSKFVKNSSRRSIYHNLIPEIYIHDTDLYKQYHTSNSGPVFEQFINQHDNTDGGSNTDLQKIVQSYKRSEMTHDHIKIPEDLRDPSTFYAEIDTYADYVIPQRRKSRTANRKPTPKLKMGMSPMALQRLFHTPRRKSVCDVKKSPMPVVQWAPDHTDSPAQYRSVLTGECVQPMTPDCSIFHGKALTTTAKVFRTLCLAYAYFVVGMCFSLLGPTLLDFTEHSEDITREQAYQFLTVRGAGVALGSVLLGTVIHVVDNYVSFAIVLTLCGVANAAFPMLFSFLYLILVEFFIGVCLGFLDTGTQILCVDIWGFDNAPYMLGIHFIYGLGTIAGPVIAQPFLREGTRPTYVSPESGKNESIYYTIFNNQSLHEYTILPEYKPTEDTIKKASNYQFQYAYFIVAGLFVSCGVLKIIIWMSNGKCRCKTNNEVYLKKSSNELTGQSSRTCLFLLTVLFMMLHLGIECSYKGLLAPYTVEVLHWSKSFGAWITALVYTTYSLGRGMGIAMGKFMEPGTLLWLNLLLMFAASLLELLTVSKYPFIMWVTASLQGLGQSTVLPACFMWASRRLQLQGITAGVLMFTSSLGMILLPGITGLMITTPYTSTKAFNIVPLATITTNMLLFCIMYCLGEKYYTEFDIPENEVDMQDRPPRNRNNNKYEDMDENANFKETTTSTRLSEYDKEHSAADITSPSKICEDDDSKCSPSVSGNLKTHHEYTGSPKTYIVNNTSFGSDMISEIKCQSEEGSVESKKSRRSNSVRMKTPMSLFQSPYSMYSMSSHTPLAVVTFANSNNTRL